MSGLRQRGVGPDRLRDLQPAIACDQLAGENQGRGEAGRPERPLRGDRDASDPEPAETFVVGSFSDTREQRAQHPATSKVLECEAVPDVALARARRDRQLELADPFRLRGKPSVPGQLLSEPGSEAAAASRHPLSYEIPLRAHRGSEQRCSGRIDLSDFDRRPGLDPPSGASRYLPGERGGKRTRNAQVRRPESASYQMEKWRWRTLSITSGSPVAEPPGSRPKNVSTRSCGES